jgi:hypothetical protein
MTKKTGILMVSVIGIILAIGLYVNGESYVQGYTTKYMNLDNHVENNEEIANNNGRERLVELENINVADVEEKIKKANKEEEAKKLLANNGQVDFKKYYKNTVFFGDSLTEFISAAEILSQNSVVATKGRNVITAKQDVEKIKSINPEKIIMLFGMNDVEVFSNSADFKTNYMDLVNQIKSALPKADIYIESPLPVQSKGVSSSKRLNNGNIAQFREVAKEVAKEENVKYVDTSVLVVNDKYFEPDGIHFVYDFYPGLLKYIRNTIEMNNIKS